MTRDARRDARKVFGGAQPSPVEPRLRTTLGTIAAHPCHLSFGAQRPVGEGRSSRMKLVCGPLWGGPHFGGEIR